MSQIKIGFDAKRLFLNKEGLGSYARTLVYDLMTYLPELDLHLYTPTIQDNNLTSDFLNHKNISIHTHDGGVNSKYWRSKSIVKDLEKHEIDVYWGLSNELPFGINKSRVKSIVTIHDLIYKNFPSQFSFFDRLIYNRKFSNAVSQSNLIVVPSESTAKDLVNQFSGAQGKIRKLYQAVHPSIRKAAPNDGSGSYLLFVGSINERKNLKLLIHAMSKLPKEEKIRTIVVGRGKRYKKECEDLIVRYGLKEFFEFKSDLTTDALIELYQQAMGLVFPSKYEGFGIPVIESLHLNVPVITANSTSLPEIVGENGIVLVNFDADTLANTLIQFKREEFRSTSLLGVKDHIKKFSPEVITNHIKGLINNVLSSE